MEVVLVRRVIRTRSVGSSVALEEFIAAPASEKPASTKRKVGIGASAFERLVLLTSELKEDADWDKFEAKNFVALYWMLHFHVYKVKPQEVVDMFSAAVSMAKRMLEREFSSNSAAMVQFMRWVWSKEQKSFARRDVENDFRIGWRYQFGSKLLSDYRVYVAKSKR